MNDYCGITVISPNSISLTFGTLYINLVPVIFDNFGKATLVNDVHLLSNIYPLVFVIDPIVTCYRALHPLNIPLLAEITPSRTTELKF